MRLCVWILTKLTCHYQPYARALGGMLPVCSPTHWEYLDSSVQLVLISFPFFQMRKQVSNKIASSGQRTLRSSGLRCSARWSHCCCHLVPEASARVVPGIVAWLCVGPHLLWQIECVCRCVLVFYCNVTKYCGWSSLKQHVFMISQFPRESRPGLTGSCS